jgi:hypothetical protein
MVWSLVWKTASLTFLVCSTEYTHNNVISLPRGLNWSLCLLVFALSNVKRNIFFVVHWPSLVTNAKKKTLTDHFLTYIHRHTQHTFQSLCLLYKVQGNSVICCWSSPTQSFSQSKSQSQSYSTTGALTPINSSWRQTPLGSRPEIFSQLNPCSYSPYVTSFLTRKTVCLLWIRLVFRQVYV